ncbi:acyl-CoA oxidase [Hyphopichia burtonii NRRL Y-1933]|uniref:Acyl-coenzyme A oxidase n=1 Tax=Hyphopichia burtonii NRRL Y-1933 TaxID=984485 RepID=A0A1E4RKU9_9ASCO|nr:acyl-CoA oxidase [Hyphopichia burtonii NRRL Y-1933]ODV67908.1 acyl-CoA oxidase [Hyphopichia burtonii NRRL Y-1933]
MSNVAVNTINSLNPPNPQSSIQEERAKNAFDPSMHEFIEGGEQKSDLILDLYQSLERDPVLQSNFKDYDLSTHANRLQTTERINRMTRYKEQEVDSEFFRRLNLVTVYDPSLGIRISVNLGLFGNCIKGNGTDSQYKYWCIDKESHNMKHLWGCFGMTELGHGSNVAGCETTATFDEKTDEFIINTPHIGATKWWIGGAAHSATHSVVYARLIVKGKDYGVKTFIVPLRDSNHELLPGVSIGDIGAKMGREGVDNGWIQFSKVRIPRFFMLQKFCKVDRDGKVSLPPLEQLSYISLLGGRVAMATDSYRICARFITIALRYSVGRLQFKKNLKDLTECQLIDYNLHQKRLLPYLALTYALALGTDRLENQHSKVLEDLDHAIESKDMDAIKQGLNETKSLFIDSGSLKSTLTWLAADCIAETRQSCGGHGYSSYNGFGKSYDDWVVQCTWEGDNNVLAMSAGKSIIKNVNDILNKNKKIDGSLKFLNNSVSNSNNEIILGKEDELNDPVIILKSLESLISRISIHCLEALKTNNSDWDSISHERVILSKLRCHHYLLETFIQRLNSNKDEKLNQHLQNLVHLYCYSSIFNDFAGQFIAFNILAPKLKLLITSRLIGNTCSKLRPYVVALTDSFQQPDNLLHSAIGNYDGNIYENYFDVVNKTNPPNITKAPYSKNLEDFLNRDSLEVRQRFEKGEEVSKILSK